MEPILFKSTNSNSYLYSPAKKELLPLPESVYKEMSENKAKVSALWQSLIKEGYLDSYKETFDGVVNEEAIKAVLLNLSQVVFETTTNCNLKCEYCCYGEGYNTFDSRRGKEGFLNFETGKAVLDFLVELFNSQPSSYSPLEPFAISFYGGEPLINFSVVKQIVEYARTLKFKNRKLRFTMTTNATFLAKYADFLHNHKFELLISLDGDKEQNKYRRTLGGLNSFELIMSNLKRVKEIYPEWFNTFNFNVVYTNISNASEIVTWFRKSFNKTPKFSPLHPPTEGAREYSKIRSMMSKLDVTSEFYTDSELMIQNPLYKRILEFSHSLFNNVINNETNLLDTEDNRYATGTCIPFSKRMFVSYKGELHSCEKINRDLPLGRISEAGEVLIDFKNVAEKFMERVSNMKKICQECYLQLCCTKCMLCFDNGRCDSFTTKQSFSQLLSQAVSHIESNPDIVQLLEDKIIIK